MTSKTETLADDLPDGADDVSKFVKIFTPRQVYFYQEELGLKHLRGRLIGSKREITKRLTGRETS
ncbi:MAG: hypothetical protein WAV38_37045 [Xanthobacteraceae bacterium]